MNMDIMKNNNNLRKDNRILNGNKLNVIKSQPKHNATMEDDTDSVSSSGIQIIFIKKPLKDSINDYNNISQCEKSSKKVVEDKDHFELVLNKSYHYQCNKITKGNVQFESKINTKKDEYLDFDTNKRSIKKRQGHHRFNTIGHEYIIKEDIKQKHVTNHSLSHSQSNHDSYLVLNKNNKDVIPIELCIGNRFEIPRKTKKEFRTEHSQIEVHGNERPEEKENMKSNENSNSFFIEYKLYEHQERNELEESVYSKSKETINNNKNKEKANQGSLTNLTKKSTLLSNNESDKPIKNIENKPDSNIKPGKMLSDQQRLLKNKKTVISQHNIIDKTSNGIKERKEFQGQICKSERPDRMAKENDTQENLKMKNKRDEELPKINQSESHKSKEERLNCRLKALSNLIHDNTKKESTLIEKKQQTIEKVNNNILSNLPNTFYQNNNNNSSQPIIKDNTSSNYTNQVEINTTYHSKTQSKISIINLKLKSRNTNQLYFYNQATPNYNNNHAFPYNSFTTENNNKSTSINTKEIDNNLYQYCYHKTHHPNPNKKIYTNYSSIIYPPNIFEHQIRIHKVVFPKQSKLIKSLSTLNNV